MPSKNLIKYRKEYAARKKIAGICVRCKNKAVPGKNLCSQCSILSKERERQRREQRLSIGLCCNCNKPSINGTTFCEKHLAKAKENTAKYRERKIASGHCIHCDAPSVPGKLCCKYHRELQAKRAKDNRNANIEKGLCPCGRERKPGTTKCKKCLDRQNYEATYRAYGGNRIKALERDGHKCRICGKSNRRMTVHHIDGCGSTSKHQNNDLDNLITLCLRCHNAFTTLCQKGNDLSVAVNLIQRYASN